MTASPRRGSTGTPPRRHADPAHHRHRQRLGDARSPRRPRRFQPGGPGTANQTPGAPYELYCPGTPVGDIALNDVVTTGSIAPTSLNEGDQFQVTNLQTQFTIPQSVAQQAENLGLTTLSGDLSLFLDVTGTQYGFNPGTGVGVASTSSSSTSSGSSDTVILSGPGPFRGPFPGQDDLSFERDPAVAGALHRRAVHRDAGAGIATRDLRGGGRSHPGVRLRGQPERECVR